MRACSRAGARTRALAVAALLAGGIALAGSTRWGATFGGRMDEARLARAAKLPYFRDGAFVNPHPTHSLRSGSMASASLGFFFAGGERTPPAPLPADPTGPLVLDSPPESGLRLTWIGHSTVLVEIDGLRLLTDPHFSRRASPFSFAGPARFQPPAIDLDALGPVDAVLLSHDHYDHLDMATVQALAARGARFFAPLGVGVHLESWGIPAERTTELAWWEEASPREGIRLVSTPAQHFSGRGLLDRNRTLWTSWAVVGPTHRVFFSGDTGLTEDFREIGGKLGPFDVSMFEVGACHPAWGDIHLGPQRALAAFRWIRSERFMPIHWGTFDLALHDWDEPIEEIWKRAPDAGIPLFAPQLGRPSEPGQDPMLEPWWRQVRSQR